MIGTINCVYETPCGWCSKWDKKCNKKIPENIIEEKQKSVINNMPSVATSVKVTAPEWFTGGDRGDILG